jgi:hemolysin activation/secretion protein
VLRFYQDWVDRNAVRVLAARSELRIGLDLFDATVNDSGTDGQFVSWLGQFQWVERIAPRLLLVSRINTQLTPDSLLPLERFSLGGVDTVRGYTQNELVTDNGIMASIELRISLLPNLEQLQLVPFIDAGHAWNNRTPDPEVDSLVGIGMGLRWLITPDLDLRVDYGIPLVDIENTGDSLQDHGLYLSLRYQAF